jgi:glyoxylase-like metal-dependent hydrolase (beta-lactamase superfamily II)
VNSTYDAFRLRVASGDVINYCYIIVDRQTNYAAVVDPAWDVEAIAGKLKETGAILKWILLTHSHEDHVDLVPELIRRYEPIVRMSRQEIEYYGFSCDNLISFQDGEKLSLGLTTVTCLVTPGHTYGSSCFLLSNDLFTGDTIFTEGCGMCTAKGGDAEAMYHSVQRMKRTVDSNVLVQPGHSFGKEPGHPIRHLHQNNIYFQFDRKEDFVSFRMRKNQSQKLLYQFQ